MERSCNRQETGREFDFSLTERYARLLQAGWRLELSQAEIQTVQGLWWSSTNEWTRSIVQCKLDLAIRSQVRVGSFEMLQDLILAQVVDGKHRCRSSFIVGKGIFQNSRVKSSRREHLLSTSTHPEQKAKSLSRVDKELFFSCRSWDNNWCDNTLTMTSRTCEKRRG